MKERQREWGIWRQREKLWSFFAAVLMVCLVVVNAFAQRATGTISGRVVAEDGQPIPHARIQIIGIGGVNPFLSGRMDIVSDENGNFHADKLDPAPYSITASAPGYVIVPNEKVGGQIGASITRYAHVGDSVTIRMIRGGVITGRVTNASGEAVIGVSIEATRVRDENGRPVSDQMNFTQMAMNRQTDDRGVYRIYGLAPGAYVVNAGAGSLGFSLKPTPFAGRMKIYYPSATRDTAGEVIVRSGDEASGIDISYRNERGFAVSGKATGIPAGQAGAMETATLVTLAKAGTEVLIATTVVMPIGDSNSYSFHGLPNGEYEAAATRPDPKGTSVMISAPRRVAVSGGDVTGIDLKLEAMASISGSVGLEKLAAPPSGQKCEASRDSFFDEIVVLAKPEEPGKKSALSLSLFSGAGAIPNDKGVFTINGLEAGRHFIESQLPDEHWYVKSGVLSSAPATNLTAREAGRNGITVKAGEKITGLAVTLGEGAAGLKGKVTATGKVPSRLRVHLLPAEPEAKDNVLRFAEVRADEDSSFAFANIAPGKYLLVARAIAEAEQTDKPAKPAAWDAAERAKLRKEAEAANATIELKTCQRVTDFSLRWTK